MHARPAASSGALRWRRPPFGGRDTMRTVARGGGRPLSTKSPAACCGACGHRYLSWRRWGWGLIALHRAVDFDRVDVGGGRRAWVARATGTMGPAHPTHPVVTYVLNNSPPVIETSAGTTLDTRTPTLAIHGTSTNDSRVLDLYIFVGPNKVFYQSNRNGADPIRSRWRLYGSPFGFNGLPFAGNGPSFGINRLPFAGNGLPFAGNGRSFRINGLPFAGNGLSFGINGDPVGGYGGTVGGYGHPFRTYGDSFGLIEDSFGLHGDSFGRYGDSCGLTRDSFGLYGDPFGA